MAKARILVVEDETIVALDLETFLEQLGYTVTATVHSGEGAINKVAETHPDLVLMDIRLQGDMDGVEAARLIRTRFSVPIIYVTAYRNEADSDRAKAITHTSFVLKPFDQRDLEAAIWRVLN